MKAAKYVWGIGLSRTGTTSLAQALGILGYKTIHYPLYFEEIKGFRAATDITILLWLETLDQKYPGSKFIWTERDINSWLTSCEKHLARSNPDARMLEIRQQCFGCTDFDQKLYLQAYQYHLAQVEEYFRDRPQDFLKIDIIAGQGWELLCPFLGKSIPKKPFPYLHNSSRNKILVFIDSIVESIKLLLASAKARIRH
ncbi:MAG: hypothetical protein F6J92_25265 [Symploca sp. SIO1A3]|nr:hypothetical protein [Symploca sp. SIO1A3]